MEPILIKYEADTSGLDEVYNSLDRLQNKEQALVKQIGDIDKEYNKFLLDVTNGGKTQVQVENEIANAMKKKDAAQKTARKELESTRQSVAALHAQADKLEGTIVKGTANKTLVRQLRSIKEELRQMEMAGDTFSQRFIDMSVKAGQLEDQIGDTNAQIRALASDTKNLDVAMGIGQGLTGIMTGATAAAALLGGENEELQKAFFKVQAALQVLNSAQMVATAMNKDSAANVVIRNSLSKLFTKNVAKETTTVAANAVATGASAVATGVNTVATGAATKATWAWNAALLANPVFWIVGVIVAVVAAFSALNYVLNASSREQERLNNLNKIHVEYLREVEGLEKRKHERYMQQLNNELSILHAKGASEQEIAKKEMEIAQEQLAYAQAQYDRNKDSILAMDENEKKLEGVKKQIVDLKNKIEEDKGFTKFVKDVAMWVGAVLGVPAAIQKLFEKSNGELLKGLQAEGDALEEVVNKAQEDILQLEEAKKKVLEEELEAQRKAVELSRRNAMAMAQVRVTEAKKGGQEELKAQITLLEEQRRQALAAENLTAGERRKIVVDSEEAIRVAKENFAKQGLQDERAGIEARLALTAEGSIEAFNLQKALLANQLAIDSENAKLTANERLKIYNDYLKKVEDLNKNSSKAQFQSSIEEDTAYLNAALANVQKGSAAELELKKQLLENQAALQIANAEATITNEQLKAAKILEIETKLQADIKQLNKEADEERIGNTQRATQAEMDAERIKAEKLSASGNIIDRMQGRLQLRDLEMQAINSEIAALEAKHQAGVVSEKEYQLQMAELRNEAAAVELAEFQEIQQAKQDIMQAGFDFGVQLINSMYEAQITALNQQLSDLEHYYTTDAEEAKNNSELKLMSEEEYKRRELAIKQEISQKEKEAAIFQATVDGIAAVVKSLSAAPWPYNLVLAGFTGASVAFQISRLSAKQPPKYAKGRKGGKGEMAWVGERGPELMWIPQSASIIPAHLSANLTPEVMKQYDLPIPRVPVMPNFTLDVAEMRRTSQQLQQYNLQIDYEKLGATIAERMPEVEQVSVQMNADENGFSKFINRRNSRTKVLNRNIIE